MMAWRLTLVIVEYKENQHFYTGWIEERLYPWRGYRTIRFNLSIPDVTSHRECRRSVQRSTNENDTVWASRKIYARVTSCDMTRDEDNDDHICRIKCSRVELKIRIFRHHIKVLSHASENVSENKLFDICAGHGWL